MGKWSEKTGGGGGFAPPPVFGRGGRGGVGMGSVNRVQHSFGYSSYVGEGVDNRPVHLTVRQIKSVEP